MAASSITTDRFPIILREGEVAQNPDDLVVVILRESDSQLREKSELGEEFDRDDYHISCDALNLWRINWRCREEWGDEVAAALHPELAAGICRHRNYNEEEFDLVLEATRERVRAPYGLPPLETALRAMRRLPIRLLAEELQNKQLLADIAGLALQLHHLQYRSYIMLPIESLRLIFGVRKVAITGAIRLLILNGLLEDTGAKFGTRRARQFRWTGEAGLHYEYVKPKPK
ncbi:MAG: hypothetical protein AB7G28_07875 [Pirellulales bacterium]